MPDAKRTQIKKKVQAGQARNKAKTENTTTVFDRAGEAAIEAKDKFTAFAKEHPIARVPRQAAIKGGSKAAGLAALGAELALAYAQQAMEAASDAGKAATPRIERFGDTALSAGRDAAHRAGDAGEAALSATRDAGKRLGKAIRSRIN